MRAERFGSSSVTVAMAAQAIQNEHQKKLDRAQRFGVALPELDAQKKQARADRFGVETKEGLEAKKQARA